MKDGYRLEFDGDTLTVTSPDPITMELPPQNRGPKVYSVREDKMQEKVETVLISTIDTQIERIQQAIGGLIQENEELNKYLTKLEKRINLYWNTFRVIGVVVLLDFLIMLWHISK